MLSCSCDAEAEVFNTKWRVARKARTCCECRQSIAPGDDYLYVSMLYDGRWDAYSTCERCASMWQAFHELGYCWMTEGLEDAYREYLDEYAPRKWTDDEERYVLSNGRTVNEQVAYVFRAPRPE